MPEAFVVMAGGGTGGHLFPGIAVARAMRRLAPGSAVHFLTTDRPLDRELLAPDRFPFTPQAVQPFPSRLWSFPTFARRWLKSRRAAASFFKQRRPLAVLGLGGYAASPAVEEARRAGIRTAILNPDAIPGRANRRLSRFADLVVTQWEVSRREFDDGVNCRSLGCPVREGFIALDASDARRQFGLHPSRATLVVTGASQGARTINQAMTLAWPDFSARNPEWQLLHLTGAADESDTRRAYDSAGLEARVLAFTHDMHVALSAADLVVSRAGASTLAELSLLGKPSILLPYPYHRDRHQHANAAVLVQAGAAVLVDDLRDGQLNRKSLLEALLTLAGDAALRERMSVAARTLAHPNAAADVARWLLEMD